MDIFKNPKVENLITLSPTTINTFNACPKKSAYLLDPEFKYLSKGSTNSSLGKIAHSVLADSDANKFLDNSTNRLSLFDEVWAKYEQVEYALLKKDWLENDVPKPFTWNKYHAIRASVKYKFLERTSKEGFRPILESRDKQGLRFPIVEKFLSSTKLGLKGKPDVIDRRDGAISITDYKTGQAFDSNKTDYIWQLHVYKILAEDVLNIKIDKLYIFDGINHEIKIDKKIIKEISSTVPLILGNLNNSKFTAKPKLETCMFCPFKVICKEFWNIATTFEIEKPLILVGKVLKIDTNDERNEISVDLELLRSVPKFNHSSIKIHKISNKSQLQIGKNYAIFENLNNLTSEHFQAKWNSMILEVNYS